MRAESLAATLVYTYNAAGLRVAQAVDGAATTFAWDWASGVPELLRQGQTRYLVGHDTLGWHDGDTWTYSLPDALGSVRQETDAAGAVVSTREWTPFGVAVGESTAGLGYTGEWFDADVGLEYLRARWYAPYLNQFVSPDTVVPNYRNPPSIHRYLYALANPINHTDPSGHTPRPPGVCPAPTENPRHMPDYVFAPSFLDWANGNQAWWSGSGIGHPVWLYCGDFCITAYLFAEETEYDQSTRVDITTRDTQETISVSSDFLEDVFMNGTGKPASAICQGKGNYICGCTRDNTCACGKGKPFELDQDIYRAVAANEEIFQQGIDEIFVPELAWPGYGNGEFKVRDTGGRIGREHLDVFVGQGPGVLSVGGPNSGGNNLANKYTWAMSQKGIPSKTCDGANGLGDVAVYEKTTWPWTGPCGSWMWSLEPLNP